MPAARPGTHVPRSQRPVHWGLHQGPENGLQEKDRPRVSSSQDTACAAPTHRLPAPPRTRPELVWPLPDCLVQVGALEVGDDNSALGDVIAEDAEGRVGLEACHESACGPTHPYLLGVTC